jgi:hypothetical protein
MTQQTKQEKIKTFYLAKQKADTDLILYWHYQTIKKSWYNKIKENNQ